MTNTRDLIHTAEQWAGHLRAYAKLDEPERIDTADLDHIANTLTALVADNHRLHQQNTTLRTTVDTGETRNLDLAQAVRDIAEIATTVSNLLHNERAQTTDKSLAAQVSAQAIELNKLSQVIEDRDEEIERLRNRVRELLHTTRDNLIHQHAAAQPLIAAAIAWHRDNFGPRRLTHLNTAVRDYLAATAIDTPTRTMPGYPCKNPDCCTPTSAGHDWPIEDGHAEATR